MDRQRFQQQLNAAVLYPKYLERKLHREQIISKGEHRYPLRKSQRYVKLAHSWAQAAVDTSFGSPDRQYRSVRLANSLCRSATPCRTLKFSDDEPAVVAAA